MGVKIAGLQLGMHWRLDDWPDEIHVSHELTPNVTRALPLFEEPQPGNCPNDGAVADIGGGKSYCIPWERYTNCREVGYCVFAKYGGEK